LHRPAAVTEKNLDRARDMIEWYSLEGIPIVDVDDSPLVELTARSQVRTSPAQVGYVRSGQAIEVIE